MKKCVCELCSMERLFCVQVLVIRTAFLSAPSFENKFPYLCFTYFFLYGLVVGCTCFEFYSWPFRDWTQTVPEPKAQVSSGTLVDKILFCNEVFFNLARSRSYIVQPFSAWNKYGSYESEIMSFCYDLLSVIIVRVQATCEQQSKNVKTSR